MSDQGFWVAVWSIRPSLRLSVTSCRLGIGRSEAISDMSGILSVVTPVQEVTS